MNLITHRLTLDVLKNGVQKILHGFFAGEVLARRIAITLTAGSTSVELAQDAVAVMYITKSNGTKSINACSVVGNTVLYDVLQTDTDTTGITMMQIKVVSNDKVVYAPIFAIEVQAAIGDDTEATTSPTYTALEEALVKAEEAYNARLVSVEIAEDLTFIATYADGTEHTSDAIKTAFEVQALDIASTISDIGTLKAEISAAEQERAAAEAQRVVEHEAALTAEAARVAAEQQRETTFTQLASDVQSALDETAALQEKVEEMASGGGDVDLSNYATKEYVDETVKNAETDLTGYATETYVDEAVSGLASTDYVDEAIKNVSTGDVDLTGYATEEYVNEAVSGLATTEEVANAVNGLASTQYVDNAVSGLATSEEVTNAVSGLATTEDVTNAVDGLASTQYVDEAVKNVDAATVGGKAVDDLPYLPDTGGEVSGDVSLVKADATAITFKVGNTSHTIGVAIDASGHAGLYDYTYSKWIVKSDNTGVTKYNGGTVEGDLSVNGEIRAYNEASDGTEVFARLMSGDSKEAALASYTKDLSVLSVLTVGLELLRYYSSTAAKWYDVLHTGNANKSVVVDTDPGVGATVSYADGTIIFVKETA